MTVSERKTPLLVLTPIVNPIQFDCYARAISGDVISEGTNIDVFAEACLLGLCFELLDLIT